MPKDMNEQQIAERIAERRAKTEELKKKRKRTVWVQIVVAVLALVLIGLLVFFAVNALAGRRSVSKPEEPAPEAPTSVPTVIVDDTQTATKPPEFDVSADTEEPDEAEPEEPEVPEEPVPEAGIYSDTVVFVDPGRGFTDLGCTSDFLKGAHESEINLAVALKVAEFLREYGFTTIMTHDTNEVPSQEDPEEYVLDQLARVSMANTNSCDLYLSLHCDNFPDNPKASGTRLYYCTDVEGSGAFADSLTAAVQAGLGTAPRIAGYDTDGAFIVTSQIAAPSVLAELGFVTNESDAALLLDEGWQSRMAESLANGIIQYFETYLKQE